MTIMTIAIAATRHSIPALFIGAGAPLADESKALASSLLLLGMTFFIADGVQTVGAGALRGVNDTRLPLVFSGATLLAVGSLWVDESIQVTPGTAHRGRLVHGARVG